MNLILGFFPHFLGSSTILLDGDKLAFQTLAEMLTTLEDQDALPVRIHQLSFVNPMDDIRLTAFPRSKESGISQMDKTQPYFTWKISDEGWLEVAEKMIHLANCNNGHNWIESQGSDDAVILISVGEYGKQWWNLNFKSRPGDRHDPGR